jgi:electron transfer flavoprotein alpha subunit
MTTRIFAYLRTDTVNFSDTAAELAAASKKIDPSLPLTALVSGFGAEFNKACDELRAVFQEVWKIAHPSLLHATPELLREALTRVSPSDAVVLMLHDDFGIDVGPGLSVKCNAAYVADVIGIEHVERSLLRVICQEFGGQLNSRVICDTSTGAVITIRPGTFRTEALVPRSGRIIEQSVVIPERRTRRYVTTLPAPAGDVDITRYDVLVSVGRGMQKQENIALAQELADEMGAALSCSRPVVDAKWLDKSRQVGTSGKTVKPKVYLACGISGQFQHLAGLKGNPFIIAINKNPKAPIFSVANVGAVADVLEVLPAMTAKLREAHAVR